METKDIELKDIELILLLMPSWVKDVPEGLCPTMYGTGSYEGDLVIVNRVRAIFKEMKWEY